MNFLSKIKTYNVFLIVAVSLGIFLRLYGLDIQGLWFDELAIVFPSTSQIPNSLKILLLNDLHPPLYPLFLYGWMNLFGNSEIAVRIPSAIFGILSIFSMYFLGKKLFNKHIVTSVTILIALSGSAILYSQEARNYSSVFLFSIISTLLWINLLNKLKESNINKKEIIIYGISCIFTSYLHYFGLIYVFFQLLYLFSFSLIIKKYRKEIFITGLAVACAILPWLFIHYPYLTSIGGGSFWIKKPDLSSIIMLLTFIFNKNLILLLFIPFLIGIRENLKRLNDSGQSFQVVSLLYLFLTPIVFIFLISQFVPIFYPRYFIIILLPFFLLISILVSSNPFFSKIKGNCYIFIISLVVLILFLFVPGNIVLNTSKSFYQPYKQQWREATKYAVDNYTPNSVIYTDRHPLMYAYYMKKLNTNGKQLTIEFYHGSMPSEYIRKIKQNYNRVFIFSNFGKIPDRMKENLELESKQCVIKEFTEVNVYDCTL